MTQKDVSDVVMATVGDPDKVVAEWLGWTNVRPCSIETELLLGKPYWVGVPPDSNGSLCKVPNYSRGERQHELLDRSCADFDVMMDWCHGSKSWSARLSGSGFLTVVLQGSKAQHEALIQCIIMLTDRT